MTEQLPELRDTWSEAVPPRRTNGDAIRAGLGFILSRQQGRCWQDLNLPSGEGDVRLTACVLARLADLPLHYITPRLQQQMDQALDWLLQARFPNGGWGSGFGEDDAETTAWAVLALRGHRRAPAPSGALELLRCCRRLDGGFAARPADSLDADSCLKSTPEITALALRALGEADPAGQGFLSSYLALASSRPAISLLVCSEILNWGRGLAAPSLLDHVAQCAALAVPTGATEQALLLHCLLRLRLKKAWPLAAELRARQAENGSWPMRERPRSFSLPQLELEDRRVLATATAVSALAMAEFQPGLYFGSDLPVPQRLPAF
ncbi:MAG TPA: prenyltransferase/squalene oxidase repeat-containing protein [Candidatus Angelobacter sp.]|nr:prenyltransferase/squalene oxidase repeat-containing protein [Candidatus Angelobacter sp.]